MIQWCKNTFSIVKPYVPATCFFGGFTWDNFTLKRIDNTLDMIIFGSYLLLCAAVIVLLGRGVKFKFSQYLPMAIQFFFGGLFSSFVVYYFKSASSLPSFIFMLFLLGMLVGNEFIEKKLNNVTLASTLWGIATFMYLNAVLPVLLKAMNGWVFLLALAASFCLYLGIRFLSANPTVRLESIGLVYGLILLFYFMNIIPPVPLAKKQMGIYRSVLRKDNNYLCAVSQPSWFLPLKKSERKYAWAQGDTVFCFSSIFAPTDLKKKIFHHWYYRDPEKKKFIQTDRIGYRMVGGREDGYRGYTFKCHVRPGKWKVALKTDDNKTLGIVSFDVVERKNQFLEYKTFNF